MHERKSAGERGSISDKDILTRIYAMLDKEMKVMETQPRFARDCPNCDDEVDVEQCVRWVGCLCESTIPDPHAAVAETGTESSE